MGHGSLCCLFARIPLGYRVRLPKYLGQAVVLSHFLPS